MDKNTATGKTRLSRRKLDVIGENMTDPFYDSYQQEADTCCVILEMMDGVESYGASFINLSFDKVFLKKIVHSYIRRIREIEKDLNGRMYA